MTKKIYASPKCFEYGDFADVVQYKGSTYYPWDFLIKRRHWWPR